MKVLITGGAGFLGSHIADRLLDRGDEVRVVDNYATGRRDNLLPRPNLQVVEGTIADRDLVERLFRDFQPTHVVHAAASYKDPDNWQEDVATNTTGTVHVVRASQRAGVSRFIYFQTALCYGLHPERQPVPVDHPIRPEGSSYAISKTAGEHYIFLSGLDYVSFRLANAYGPRNVSGPLPTFFARLTTGKPCFVVDTRRDFVYVDDLANVVMKALDGRGHKGVYHVSSGTDVSIKELFDATVHALGIQLDRDVEVRPRSPDDAPSILLDPSRTQVDFAWRTETPLAVGVDRAIGYYRERGIHQTFTHLKSIPRSG